MGSNPTPSAKPKYWYMFYESYCPICAHTEVIKERVYDRPKPKEWNERHDIIERWDYCNAL